MASKSCPTRSTIQSSQFSAAQLGRHTDPIMYTVGECTSDGRKTSSKRLAEESLERGSKRSRTSQSSSEDSGQSVITISSDSSDSGQSVITISSDSSDSGQSVITISSDSSDSGQSVITISSDSSDSGQSVITISSDSSDSSPPVSKGEIQKLSRKRKSTSDGRDERPEKRARRTPSPSESPDHQAATEASPSEVTAPPHSRAAFNAKYEEGTLLGEGGFGSVFAGHRKADNLPVAIKHIRQMSSIKLTPVELEGKRCVVPLEVALLLKLQPKAGETSAVVALLEWYDLDDELILVLERPVPCVDMIKYIHSQPLSENEAKILTRQLVDALIEVHSKGVFHNDIKLENILVETGSDVPRVRIIDFGCGTFLREGWYHTQQGTPIYTSPEWFRQGLYKAEPATVWQLGVTVFAMLHQSLPFRHEQDIINIDKWPDINQSLSLECEHFLGCCLERLPQNRDTLEELKSHVWLE